RHSFPPRRSSDLSVEATSASVIPGISEAATQSAAALISTRSRKPTRCSVRAEREPDGAVERQDAGTADEDRERHRDEREVELEARPLARDAEIQEEAVLAVDLGNGHQHDHDDADGRRAREQSDDHAEAAEELDE